MHYNSLIFFFIATCLCVFSVYFLPQDPLLKGRRCVILADGFYEWRRQQKDKQPFFIYFPQDQGYKQNEMKKDEHCEGEPRVRLCDYDSIHSERNCVCIMISHQRETPTLKSLM